MQPQVHRPIARNIVGAPPLRPPTALPCGDRVPGSRRSPSPRGAACVALRRCWPSQPQERGLGPGPDARRGQPWLGREAGAISSPLDRQCVPVRPLRTLQGTFLSRLGPPSDPLHPTKSPVKPRKYAISEAAVGQIGPKARFCTTDPRPRGHPNRRVGLAMIAGLNHKSRATPTERSPGGGGHSFGLYSVLCPAASVASHCPHCHHRVRPREPHRLARHATGPAGAA